MICGDAVYAPCPPPRGTHTAPPTPPGTAFTGANLTVGMVVFDLTIVIAVIATALRRWSRS